MNKREDFLEKIENESEKKVRARAEGDQVLFGLGAFGVVGWSVAIPSILMTYLGIYLDKKSNLNISWTLTLMLLGLALGCFNAWYWIAEKSGRNKK